MPIHVLVFSVFSFLLMSDSEQDNFDRILPFLHSEGHSGDGADSNDNRRRYSCRVVRGIKSTRTVIWTSQIGDIPHAGVSRFDIPMYVVSSPRSLLTVTCSRSKSEETETQSWIQNYRRQNNQKVWWTSDTSFCFVFSFIKIVHKLSPMHLPPRPRLFALSSHLNKRFCEISCQAHECSWVKSVSSVLLGINPY